MELQAQCLSHEAAQKPDEIIFRRFVGDKELVSSIPTRKESKFVRYLLLHKSRLSLLKCSCIR